MAPEKKAAEEQGTMAKLLQKDGVLATVALTIWALTHFGYVVPGQREMNNDLINKLQVIEKHISDGQISQQQNQMETSAEMARMSYRIQQIERRLKIDE